MTAPAMTENDWRVHAHNAFDQLWLRRYMTQRQAYEWLGSHLGVPEEEAHIAALNAEQCQALIPAVHREVAAQAAAATRPFNQRARPVLKATLGELVARHARAT